MASAVPMSRRRTTSRTRSRRRCTRATLRAQLRDFYEQDVRPFLQPSIPAGNPLLDPVQVEARFSKLRRLPGMDEVGGEVDRLARFCEERRLLREQERIHFWLHAWLLVHVPLTVALLVLGAIHVVTGALTTDVLS